MLSGLNIEVPPNVPRCIAVAEADSALPVVRNFIGGSFVPSRGCPDRLICDTNPATGADIAYLPCSNKTDATDAIEAAHKAHKCGTWRNLPVNERARILDRISALIESHLEELALIETQDTGKPLSFSRSVDIPRAVDNFRFFASSIRTSTSQSTMPMPGVLNYTQRSPLGVVVFIKPWNLPLYLLTFGLAAALAMGNCAVCKPSEWTSRTAHRMCELIDEEKLLPPGVLNLVIGYGSDLGPTLTTDPRVAAISFTGGTATGRVVAANAVASGKKLSLELGGKNPSIVFEDCLPQLAQTCTNVLRAAFSNTGQICLCGSRILVQRSIFDPFKAKFVEMVQQTIRVGDPLDTRTTMGPLISAPHRQKIVNSIEALRQAGAVIECGGEASGFAFFSPTVVSGISHELIMNHEFFGPVVSLHPFDTEEEAIEMANTSRYGLAGTVWTRDLTRAHRVAESIDVGMVWVNCWLLRDLRVPFGGVKDSGEGREGGEYSLRFFSEDKNICIKYYD